MSFSSIRIHRDLPIINGYVQLPPCRDQEKTKKTTDEALDALGSAQVVRLSLGSGQQQGGRHGQQEILRLPYITPNTWYASDPVETISDS